MILRRFMKHVTEQNWFAVGLDVIVVIVGIFLGLQVQNWYEERGNRELELDYLTQMHSEIASATQVLIVPIEMMKIDLGHLNDVRAFLIETGNIPVLSEAQCNAIVMSHVYTNFIRPINSLNELGSTDRSTLIKNNKIRTFMNRYKNMTAANDRISNQMMSRAEALPEAFSELIELRMYVGSTPVAVKTGNKCHSELMNANISFKNHLVGNVTRFEGFSNVSSRQYEILNQLHSAIDEELDITHEEAEL